MRQVHRRGEDFGRFVHGSFGSGKSHFMAYLGMLLEGKKIAWEKDDPVVAELRKEHAEWIREAGLLVVRLHMLTAEREDAGFDRLVYEAFNRTLAQRDEPPFEFLHVDGVLDEARREAEQYGDAFWQRLASAGIVASKRSFDAVGSRAVS